MTSVRTAAFLLATLAGTPYLMPAFAQSLHPRDAAITIASQQAAEVDLLALLDAHVAWLDEQDPLGASLRGNDAFASKLRDESPEAYTARALVMTARLKALQSIAPDTLSDARRLDRDLLIYDLQLSLDGEQFFPQQLPVDSLNGPHIWLPQMPDRIPLATQAHRESYVARLEAIPMYLEQITRQMRAGLIAGRTPPRIVLAKTLGSVQQLCSDDVKDTPQISPFFKPFAGKPIDADPLAQRALAAIRDGITPAFESFAAFLSKSYIPACRESIGASNGGDGIAFYNYRLRDQTTTTLTAREIHDLGLKEVASLKREMMATIAETGFIAPAGTPPGDDALFAAFLAHTRTEKFLWKTPEEMMTDYRELCKRIDAELPRLFRTLPRNTYGVREIPAFAARTSPVAYYYPGSSTTGVPGYFMVNTSNLTLRPKFARTSLTIHEAVPGHHFQVAIAQELASEGGQHPYSTRLGFTAFVEGWGLYSERLGLEMGETRGSALAPTAKNRGFYQDPYDNFGRLSDEIWRACRLVVDTGMHAFGWSRQQAIDYLLANTAISTLDAASEVDRYIGWPGQACAYKIGQLEILAMREDAERRLADKFSVRDFHDAVLGSGAIPLPVLKEIIERWIKSQEAAPSN